MANTLGLDDDLDPVEVQLDIEATFNIWLTTEESVSCRTVGDIYAILRSRFSDSHGTQRGCATAMAFYRLRHAFKTMDVVARLEPETKVGTLTTLSSRMLFKQLSLHSGLRLPHRSAGRWGALGTWSTGVGLIVIPIAAFPAPPHLWLAAVFLIAFGALLGFVDPGRLPADCVTLGGLSKKVAGLNFGRLFSVGAAPREKDLWNALVEVLSEHVVLPKLKFSLELCFCTETFGQHSGLIRA